jgi:hypothetical protein
VCDRCSIDAEQIPVDSGTCFPRRGKCDQDVRFVVGANINDRWLRGPNVSPLLGPFMRDSGVSAHIVYIKICNTNFPAAAIVGHAGLPGTDTFSNRLQQYTVQRFVTFPVAQWRRHHGN